MHFLQFLLFIGFKANLFYSCGTVSSTLLESSSFFARYGAPSRPWSSCSKFKMRARGRRRTIGCGPRVFKLEVGRPQEPRIERSRCSHGWLAGSGLSWHHIVTKGIVLSAVKRWWLIKSALSVSIRRFEMSAQSCLKKAVVRGSVGATTCVCKISAQLLSPLASASRCTARGRLYWVANRNLFARHVWEVHVYNQSKSKL